MGITIRIFKTEVEKFPSLMAETVPLSHIAIEKTEFLILVPRIGSLFDVLRVLMKYNISYELKHSVADEGQRT